MHNTTYDTPIMGSLRASQPDLSTRQSNQIEAPDKNSRLVTTPKRILLPVWPNNLLNAH
jgi:hypothetical protein